jgi:hypothetical protein
LQEKEQGQVGGAGAANTIASLTLTQLTPCQKHRMSAMEKFPLWGYVMGT